MSSMQAKRQDAISSKIVLVSRKKDPLKIGEKILNIKVCLSYGAW